MGKSPSPDAVPERKGSFLLRCRRAAASVWVAVLLMALVAAACILATLLPQRQPEDYYTETFGSFGSDLLEALHVTDIIHSTWFAALLGAFTANLLLCTIRRRPTRLRQLGFLLTHVGVLLFSLGCIIGLQSNFRGKIKLTVGTASSVARATTNKSAASDGETHELPFELHLDDFEVEHYEDRFRFRAATQDQQWQFDRGLDDPQELVGGDYTIKVTDAGYARRGIKQRSEPGRHPVIRVDMLHTGESYFLDPASPETMAAQTSDRSFLLYLLVRNEDDIQQLITGQQPQIAVMIPKRDIKLKMGMEPGTKLEIGETDMTVEVLRYFPSFRVGPDGPTSVSEEPKNPAVLLRVVSDEGESTHYLFAFHPNFDSADGRPRPNLRLRFVWPPGLDHDRRLYIVETPEGKRQLLHFVEDRLAQRDPAPVGKTIDIEGTPGRISIARAMSNGRIGWDVSKEPRSGAVVAVKVGVRGPNGSDSRWLPLQTVDTMMTSDRRLALAYQGKSGTAKLYKSSVRVVEDGETVARRDITVNNPLRYGGYCIYQDSYDPRTEMASTLGVYRDAGLWIVYTSFAFICAGVAFIFYIKPLLARR